MKKRIVLSNIEWDCDGDNPKDFNLPDTVVVENPGAALIAEVEDEGYSDVLESYLSDTYGFCVFGFAADVDTVG